MHLATSGPLAMDVTRPIDDFRLSARYAVDATGMPSGALAITLSPFSRAADVHTPPIRAASVAHASLTQSVFSFRGEGAVSGIPIALKGARVTSDQTVGPKESAQLSATGFSITDIASGRTAATP